MSHFRIAPAGFAGRAGARFHAPRRRRVRNRVAGRLSRPDPVVPRAVHRAVVPVLPAGDRPGGNDRSSTQGIGVETLGIVATPPENARLYFKFRPTRLRLAADPELTTHRAFGLPKPAATPEFMKALETIRINPDGILPEPLPIMEAAAAVGKARRLCGESRPTVPTWSGSGLSSRASS